MGARGLSALGRDVEVASRRSRGRPRKVVVREQLDEALVVALLRDERFGDPPVVRGSAAMEDALVRDLTDHGALEPVALGLLRDPTARAAARRPRARRGLPAPISGFVAVAAIRSTVKVLPMTDASCSTRRGLIGQGVDAGFDELLDRARDLDACRGRRRVTIRPRSAPPRPRRRATARSPRRMRGCRRLVSRA